MYPTFSVIQDRGLDPDLDRLEIVWHDSLPEVFLMDAEEAASPFIGISRSLFFNNGIRYPLTQALRTWVRSKIQDGSLYFDRILNTWRYLL